MGTLIWLIVTFGLIYLVVGKFLNAPKNPEPRLLYELLSIALGAYVAGMQLPVLFGLFGGKQVAYRQAFSFGAKYWWRQFLLEILVVLTVMGGLLLFIVPGIIFGLRLVLAPYFIVDRDMSAMDAYKASWHATKGNLGKIWGIIGVTVLILLPVIVAFASFALITFAFHLISVLVTIIILPVILIIGGGITAYLAFSYMPSTTMLYLYLKDQQGDKSIAPVV